MTRDEAIKAANSLMAKSGRMRAFLNDKEELVAEGVKAAFLADTSIIDQILPYIPARLSAESEGE